MALTTVNSGGIKDDSIVNADIKSDAAIALSKLASTPAVLTGSTNNTITTVTAANTIQGEANLTFDGSTLNVVDGGAIIGGSTDADVLLRLDHEDNTGKAELQLNAFGTASVSLISNFSGSTYQGVENGSFGLSSAHARDINFVTAGSERFRIRSGGDVQVMTNLGIGINPSKKLHVQGLDVALRLESTAATGRIGMEFYDTSAQKGFFGYPSSGNDNLAIQQNEASDLYFYVNGADRLHIRSGGETYFTRQADGGAEHVGNTANQWFKVGTWAGPSVDGAARCTITVLGTDTHNSGANLGGETKIYLAFDALAVCRGTYYSTTAGYAGLIGVAHKYDSTAKRLEIWVR